MPLLGLILYYHRVLVVLRSKIACYIDIHKRAASTELPRRLAAQVTLNHNHKAFSNSQPIFAFEIQALDIFAFRIRNFIADANC